MDKNMLLYYIKKQGLKVEEFCKMMKIGKATFYRRCSENTFRVKDIWKIAEILELTQEDISAIFFANIVS